MDAGKCRFYAVPVGNGEFLIYTRNDNGAVCCIGIYREERL